MARPIPREAPVTMAVFPLSVVPITSPLFHSGGYWRSLSRAAEVQYQTRPTAPQVYCLPPQHSSLWKDSENQCALWHRLHLKKLQRQSDAHAEPNRTRPTRTAGIG